MIFNPVLEEARLIRRYKRFLADVETSAGERFTVHCPNTGSMMNCQNPGSRVWYSVSGNPKRKYPCTWEIVETQQKNLVGINTSRANALVGEALEARIIDELTGYKAIRTEVPYGKERSRIDFLLTDNDDPRMLDCYVEVKNVSLGYGDGLGLFPDAVTTRGQKHLRELMELKSSGTRAVLFFCIQHNGVERIEPADSIDPAYGVLLREAAACGVELIAYAAVMAPGEIRLNRKVAVHLPPLGK